MLSVFLIRDIVLRVFVPALRICMHRFNHKIKSVLCIEASITTDMMKAKPQLPLSINGMR